MTKYATTFACMQYVKFKSKTSTVFHNDLVKILEVLRSGAQITYLGINSRIAESVIGFLLNEGIEAGYAALSNEQLAIFETQPKITDYLFYSKM